MHNFTGNTSTMDKLMITDTEVPSYMVLCTYYLRIGLPKLGRLTG